MLAKKLREKNTGMQKNRHGKASPCEHKTAANRERKIIIGLSAMCSITLDDADGDRLSAIKCKSEREWRKSAGLVG